MISTELEKILRTAGWHPGRKVSITSWVNTLQREGFNVIPQATTILESYLGLKLVPIPSPSSIYATSIVYFDPLQEAELDRITDWEEELTMKMTPIGATSDSCLLIAEDGCVYNMWDRFLWMHGTSILDALDNTLVFARRKSVEIFRKDEDLSTRPY